MGVNIEAELRAYRKFIAAGMSPAGACGLIGNLEAESDGFYAWRLEYLCVQRLKEFGIRDKAGNFYTQESYTAALDAKDISCEEFLYPIPGRQYGYGFAQWTTPARKAELWNRARQQGVSMADEGMQLDYLLWELKNRYSGVLKVLRSATSIREASDKVLYDFESPDGIDGSMMVGRAIRGQRFYDTLKEEVHMISNCGHDEKNGYSGGQAGDQTGGEWALINWYKRPWNCVLRHPNPAVQADIAKLAVAAAKNNLIGYDQNQRYTFWEHLKASGYEPAKITVKCEADCSSGVAAIVKAVGYRLDAQMLKYVSIYLYTGNMRAALEGVGFKVLTVDRYTSGSDYLLPGDILLNEAHHVAINVTKGVYADKSDAATENQNGGTCDVELKTFVKGAQDNQVKTIQRILNALGYKGKDGKKLTVDGSLGDNSAYAIEQLQRKEGMVNINYGTVAAGTWKLLLNAE